MKINRFAPASCCGKKEAGFKLEKPISIDLANYLISKGFTQRKHFTDGGIIYAENKALTVNGEFGKDVLYIKCKIDNCSNFVDELETLLTDMV